MAELLRQVPGVKSASATRWPAQAVVVRVCGKACNKSLCDAVATEGFGASVVRVVQHGQPPPAKKPPEVRKPENEKQPAKKSPPKKPPAKKPDAK